MINFYKNFYKNKKQHLIELVPNEVINFYGYPLIVSNLLAKKCLKYKIISNKKDNNGWFLLTKKGIKFIKKSIVNG